MKNASAVWGRQSIPKPSVLDIRTELQKLASLLHMPLLVNAFEAPMLRLPAAHLAHDMKIPVDEIHLVALFSMLRSAAFRAYQFSLPLLNLIS